jgi:hypothetical protein
VIVVAARAEDEGQTGEQGRRPAGSGCEHVFLQR